MVVHYLGERCFRLQSGETSLLVDPVNNRLKADVVLRTLTPTGIVSENANEAVFPGEYEMKGMEIQGWPVAAESNDKLLKTVFVVRWEDIICAFMGHIAKLPDPELIEKIGEPDVLFLPVNGDTYLPTEHAAKLIKQLEPHYIITSHSKGPNNILKALGQKAESADKLVFKKKDISGERSRVVYLENRAL